MVNSVYGATVKGTIYSFDLEEQTDVIVTVNSQPEQTIVSKDGSYSFELDKGEYVINASHYSGGELSEFVSEKITISSEGEYTVDLILFPSFEEEDEILEDLNEDLVEEDKDYTLLVFVFAAILFFVFVLIFVKYQIDLRNVKAEVHQKSEDGLKKDVLHFIQEEGGRVSQKDIRKKFQYSEAKISLIITELEHKGKVERIKKGRGNVIVLK